MSSQPQTSDGTMAETIGIVVIAIPAILLLGILVLAAVVAVYSIYRRNKINRIHIADPEYGYEIGNQAAEEGNILGVKQNQLLFNSASCPEEFVTASVSGTLRPIYLKPETGVQQRTSYPMLAADSRRYNDDTMEAICETVVETATEREENGLGTSARKPKPQQRRRATFGPFRLTNKTKFEFRFIKNGLPFFYKRSARVAPMDQEMTEVILPKERNSSRVKNKKTTDKSQGYNNLSNKNRSRGFKSPLPTIVMPVPWTDDCLITHVKEPSKRGAKQSIPVISGVNFLCGPPIENETPKSDAHVAFVKSQRRGSVKSVAPTKRGIRGLLKRRPSTKSQAHFGRENPVVNEPINLHLMKSFNLDGNEFSSHTGQLAQQSDLSQPKRLIPKDSSMVTHGPSSIGRDRASLDPGQSVPVTGVQSELTQFSSIVPSAESTDYSAQFYGLHASNEELPEDSNQVKLPTIDPIFRYTEVQRPETKDFGDMQFSGISSLDEGEDSNYKLSDILGSSVDSNAERQSIELRESVLQKSVNAELSTIIEDSEETSFTTQQAGAVINIHSTGTAAAAITGQRGPSAVKGTLKDLTINRVAGVGDHGIPVGGTADAAAPEHTPGVVNISKISTMIKHLVPSTGSENDSVSTNLSQRATNRLSRDGREIQLEMRNMEKGDAVKDKKYGRRMDAGTLRSKLDSMDDSDVASLSNGPRNARGWGANATGDSEAVDTEQESQLQSITGDSTNYLESQPEDQKSLLEYGHAGFKHSRRKMKRNPTKTLKDGSMQTCYRGDVEGNWNMKRLKEDETEMISLTDQITMTDSLSAKDHSMDQGSNKSSDLAHEKSADRVGSRPSFTLIPPRSKSRKYKKRSRTAESEDHDSVFPSVSAEQRDRATKTLAERHQAGTLFEGMDETTSAAKKEKKGSLFVGKDDSTFSFNDRATDDIVRDRSMDQFSLSTSINLRSPSSKSRRYTRRSTIASFVEAKNEEVSPDESGSDIPTLSTFEVKPRHHAQVDMNLGNRPVKTGKKGPSILKSLRTTRNDSELLLSDQQGATSDSGSDIPTLGTTEIKQRQRAQPEMNLGNRPVKTGKKGPSILKSLRTTGNDSELLLSDQQGATSDSGSDIPTLGTTEIKQRQRAQPMNLGNVLVKSSGKPRAPAILKSLRTTTHGSKLLFSEQNQGELDGGGKILKQIKEIGSEEVSSRGSSTKKASKRVIFETSQDNMSKGIPSLDMLGSADHHAKAVALSGGDFEHRIDDDVEFGKRKGLPSLMIVEDALKYAENELGKRDSQLLRSEAESDII